MSLTLQMERRKTNRGKNCGRLFIVGALAALASLVNPFGARMISLYLGLPKDLMGSVAGMFSLYLGLPKALTDSVAGSSGFTMPQVIELMPPLKESLTFSAITWSIFCYIFLMG